MIYDWQFFRFATLVAKSLCLFCFESFQWFPWGDIRGNWGNSYMITLLASAWFCFLLFLLYTDSTFNCRKVYMHIRQWKHKSCSVHSRCKNRQNLQSNHLNSFKSNNQVSFPVNIWSFLTKLAVSYGSKI